MTRSKKQFALWAVIVAAALGVIGWCVYRVDPLIHYHAPDTDSYYYTLDNERSQNDGIVKHFTYDALITGTSLSQNFHTSELDALFDMTSIKVTYTAGTFKEVNDRLTTALENNPDLKLVIRDLSKSYWFYDKDALSYDQDSLPTYLYDSNPFNDIQYLFNRDVIWSRTYTMLAERKEADFTPGITSFDDYSNWQYYNSYGVNAVLPDGLDNFEPGEPVHLTDTERETIRNNLEQNVIAPAREHPDISFYCFIPPYSAVWWQQTIEDGTVYQYLEAEQEVIELILDETDNIHLFSFSTCTDLTTDLNNYWDAHHYGMWVNSLMLQCMYNGEYELTEDNYLDYLAEEQDFYLSFDYLSLNGQEDYEADLFAAALLNADLTGATPLSLMDTPGLTLRDAVIVSNQHDGADGILCTGTLSRVSEDEYSVGQSLYDGSYIGASVTLDDISGYSCLVFYGQKLADHGQPTVMVFDSETGQTLAELNVNYRYIDEEQHQYALDVSGLTGSVTIVFHGGYIDDTGSEASSYIFSDIVLY